MIIQIIALTEQGNIALKRMLEDSKAQNRVIVHTTKEEPFTLEVSFKGMLATLNEKMLGIEKLRLFYITKFKGMLTQYKCSDKDYSLIVIDA